MIVNVSRRGLIKGMAASGGLVLAAQFLGVEALAYPTGADAMPNKTVSDPHVFVSIAPDGIVTIVAARAEMGTGAARTTLPMIVADEIEADWSKVTHHAGAGRREEIRQSGHRRLAQRPPLHPADAPVRRLGAHDAGAGRGQALGRRCCRGRGEEPRDRAREVRPQARLRRARRRCGRAADTASRCCEAQGRARVPLHRQGQRPGGRPVRHHHGQSDLRPGRPCSGHEVRGRSRARRSSAARSRRSTKQPP